MQRQRKVGAAQFGAPPCFLHHLGPGVSVARARERPEQREAADYCGCSRRLTEDGGGAKEPCWFLALCTQGFAAQVVGFLPAVAGGALPRSVSAWSGGAALAERDFGITMVCSGCYSHHWGPSGRYLCHTHASPKSWSNYTEKGYVGDCRPQVSGLPVNNLFSSALSRHNFYILYCFSQWK